MLQELWYDRPVRTQLLVAVGLINLLAAVVAVSVSILNTRTATRYGIRSIPTLIVFKGGELVDQVIGFRPKSDLKRSLEKAFSGIA